jgi:nucleoside-diphosphate-sugar epimerase
MRKVVIFGGGGYIGNVLCRQYLDRGYAVKCVDNFHKGQCDALLSIINNVNFEFVNGSVCDLQVCRDNIKDCDCVVNLAGIVGFPACKKQPSLSYDVTVNGTKNILEARNLISYSIPLFFASTGSVYGKLEEICTEESQTNPQSLYGRHKLEAEHIVTLTNQPNVLSYRFATCFGVSPSMRVNLLINDLVYRAVSERCLVIFEPDAKRTFIHIKDFCRSIIWGLEHIDTLRYNLYNCGDDNLNWSKRQVAEYIAKKTDCVVNYAEFSKDLDCRDYSVSHQRLNSEGFKCQYSIEEGIEELLKASKILNIRHQYE